MCERSVNKRCDSLFGVFQSSGHNKQIVAIRTLTPAAEPQNPLNGYWILNREY